MESFAPKSFSFGALSPSSIITRCKNTLKSISQKSCYLCFICFQFWFSYETLLDYGAGNVRSVKNAIRYLGFEIEEIFDKNENEVRNLGKPVELGGQYFKNGADEVSFLNITGFRDFPLGDLPVLQVLKHTSENVFGAFASAMNVLTKTGVSQEGKVVSIGRKMKEKIKGYVSSLISFDKSRMHEFAEASNKKSITKQDENRGWFKVCLMVFLLLPNGLRCVRSEDMGNALIPGSTAMNSLLVNKNLRGFEPSGRRQMVGFNYNNFPRGNSGTSNPPVKQANPYQRPCNAAEYCRQGNKGKN